MKKINQALRLGLLTALFMHINLFAQVPFLPNLNQDAPGVEWRLLKGQYSEAIYPSDMKEVALRSLALMDFYIDYYLQNEQELLGLGLKKFELKHFPLILRGHQLSPNGFVTLAPRRTEWFADTNLDPMIGSLEWYHALAVHELEHLLQFDEYNKNTNLGLYYLFGDAGRFIALGTGARAWFLEGDAVYHETRFSEAGRGRSPRFLASLFHYVLNDQMPEYDQLIAGNPNEYYPNFYAWGFYLAWKARQLYHPNIWQLLIERASDGNYSPYSFYRAFRYITGEEFEDFYQEAIKSLKEDLYKTYPALKKEKKNFIKRQKRISQVMYSRDGTLISLERDFDDFMTFYAQNEVLESEKKKEARKEQKKDKSKKNKIHQVRSLNSRFFVYQNQVLFTQIYPDYRYALRNSSDLHIIDLSQNQKTIKRITFGQKLFHPALLTDQTSNTQIISAIQLKGLHDWGIGFFTLEGEELLAWQHPDRKIIEAQINLPWAYLLTQDNKGAKRIEQFHLDIDFKRRKVKSAQKRFESASTYSNIGNLHLQGEYLSFDQDNQQVLRARLLNTNDLKLYTCDDETPRFLKMSPTTYQNKITWIERNLWDHEVVKTFDIALVCKVDSRWPNEFNLRSQMSDSSQSELANYFLQHKLSHEKIFKNIDNLYQYSRKENKSKEMKTQTNQYQYQDKNYSTRVSEFIPHTWSYIGGLGSSLEIASNNLLATQAISARITDSPDFEFKEQFLGYSYLGLPVTISLQAQRIYNKGVNLLTPEDALQTDETQMGLEVALPYKKRWNLYELNILMSANYKKGDLISAFSEIENNKNERDRNYFQLGHSFHFNFGKDLTRLALASDFSIDFTFSQRRRSFDHFENQETNQTFYALNTSIKTPFKEDGLRLKFRQEHNNFSLLYIFPSFEEGVSMYAMSRGYEIVNSTFFHKSSIDYSHNLAYKPLPSNSWLSTSRAYINFFYDHTSFRIRRNINSFQMRSYGAEVYLDSLLFRIVPLVIGFRHSVLVDDIFPEQESQNQDLIIGLNAAF